MGKIINSEKESDVIINDKIELANLILEGNREYDIMDSRNNTKADMICRKCYIAEKILAAGFSKRKEV